MFALDNDARQEGIGAVLSQEQDNQEQVIAYASRTLTKAEQKYCHHKRTLTFINQGSNK